jgi:hypothetical protein
MQREAQKPLQALNRLFRRESSGSQTTRICTVWLMTDIAGACCDDIPTA